jgi:dihydrofolate reductase
MIISIVVAADERNGIGKNNQLLWHLPADLKHFRNITYGNAVIMGRKTFESIGKPLPGRKNIIISSRRDLRIEGVEVVNSIDQALDACRNNKEVFIIGGGNIFRQIINITDKIYYTLVHHRFDADVFFPELDPEKWEVLSVEKHSKDEKNPYDYTFINYIRKLKPATDTSTIEDH